MKLSVLPAILILGLLIPAPADASLTVFQTFTGSVGLSTDGWGSAASSSGTISASVPAGASVLGAYLYTSTYSFSAPLASAAGTLNGTPVTYVSLGTNSDACCNLQAFRANVTSIAASVINGGPGGVYNFTVTEGNTVQQDGEALVVVYSLPALPQATVAILDGFARVSGDSTSINFSTPLNPAAPGFFAEMALGIGFSCCDSQYSTVRVNGTTITERAGNKDDGIDATGFNGQLITVGGFDDPFSPFLPTYETDHERYNLTPYITSGNTSIQIQTFNTSRDDNIFLAAFRVSGIAGVNEAPPNTNPIPEPASMTLLASGLAAYAARRYRRGGQQ